MAISNIKISHSRFILFAESFIRGFEFELSSLLQGIGIVSWLKNLRGCVEFACITGRNGKQSGISLAQLQVVHATVASCTLQLQDIMCDSINACLVHWDSESVLGGNRLSRFCA